MKKWLKLSHHLHSGKVRGHEHTSYLPLGILLVIASIPLSVFTVSAISPGPQSGSVGLTGSVPGKAPKTAATITSPANLTHYTVMPVPVKGKCEAGTLVELYKNDIFAGSAVCDGNGTYSVEIDLMVGQNKVVAKTYDALNQPGPDSDPLTLFYDAVTNGAAASQSLFFDGAQLVLNTSAVFRGSFPEQSFDVPIDILGGAPPYALNVEWGDTTNKIVSRDSSASFTLAHAYAKAGTYRITIQATDAKGRIAFLTVASIVNGQVAPTVTATTGGDSSQNELLKTLLVLWPLYAGAFAAVTSFWLGERREKHILRKNGLLAGV